MYRILTVDDEDMIRALIRKYAEFEGHEVTEARLKWLLQQLWLKNCVR